MYEVRHEGSKWVVRSKINGKIIAIRENQKDAERMRKARQDHELKMKYMNRNIK